jgi:serine/threonine protein kinase
LIQPENILFSERGKKGELKIADFGFALDLMNSKRPFHNSLNL